MKTLTKLAALAVAMGFALQTQANLITPDGNLVENDNDDAAFFGSGIVLLYKANYDDGVFDSEEGNTDFGPGGPQITIVHPDPDNQTATISWDLTGTGYVLDFVAWKGGNHFLWSGVETDQQITGGPHSIDTGLILVGKGNNPAISHISFYGHRSTSVPDGGATVMLLGVALGGLGMLGRYMKRK